MAPIPTKHIDGDASVGRHVAAGGNATVRGDVTVGHNLKVEGWLEAPNVKGANKGMFYSAEELQAAYPNPEPGWWAIVGQQFPADLYMAEDGGWVTYGMIEGVQIDGSALLGALDKDVVRNAALQIDKESKSLQLRLLLHNPAEGSSTTEVRECPVATEQNDGAMSAAHVEELEKQKELRKNLDTHFVYDVSVAASAIGVRLKQAAYDPVARSTMSTETYIPVVSEQQAGIVTPAIMANALRKTAQTLTPEEQAQVKMNLGIKDRQWVIDLFDADPNGRYVPETDSFKLNELDLTWEDALNIAWWGVKNLTTDAYCAHSSSVPKIRTNLSVGTFDTMPYSVQGLFDHQDELEVARVGALENSKLGVVHTNGFESAFAGCRKLRKIIGVLNCRNLKFFVNTFNSCENLEEVRLSYLIANLDIRWCFNLSHASVEYMVAQAINTAAITITVHPDVFAKLTDETNTEWHKVFTDAQAKNISFATA